MSHDPFIRRLSQLDKASSQFSSQLTTLLSEITNRNQVSNLSAQDVLWLTEYLNNILIDTLTPASSAFKRSLSVLVQTCKTGRILPKSCMLPDTPLITGSHPFALGAVADTYAATLDSINVCVKQTRTYFAHSNEGIWLDVFYQEAIMWMHLRHPNIVPFLGATSTPFQLVSKWMSGGSLMRYVREQPGANLLSLLLGIAEGLNHLHSCDIVHGNLNGPSIQVDDLERACLTDFGLSTITPDLEPTEPARKYYLIRYAAPEILYGEASISKETDVYAFGMVVIEVFSGAAPFADSTPASVVAQVLLRERPKRPNDPIMTDGLWALTQRCLEENPRRRPEITEVVCYLRRALAIQQDRACVTDVKMDSYDSFQRVESKYSDILDGVRYAPSESRNLLRTAGTWLLSCGAPSAHDYQDGIPILLAPDFTGRLVSTVECAQPNHIQLSRSGFQGPPLFANQNYNSLGQYSVSESGLGSRGTSSPEMRMTVVPQRLYARTGDRKKHESIAFKVNGRLGIPIRDAIKKIYAGLEGRDDPVLVEQSSVIQLRLEWPGYPPWSRKIRLDDWKKASQRISLKKLATEVSKCLERFILVHADKHSDRECSDWRVGPEFIEVNRLVLIALDNVSKGSWQPRIGLLGECP